MQTLTTSDYRGQSYHGVDEDDSYPLYVILLCQYYVF